MILDSKIRLASNSVKKESEAKCTNCARLERKYQAVLDENKELKAKNNHLQTMLATSRAYVKDLLTDEQLETATDIIGNKKRVRSFHSHN